MNRDIWHAPIQRSLFRAHAGRIFYSLQRYVHWLTQRDLYRATYDTNPFSYIIYTHRVPLLRKLRNVEMWMQHNKVHNLKLAIKKLDGIILNPGKALSYWKQIGNPTKHKGYLPGMILNRGNFTAGTGGGLCQLSNLIFWMTIHTPLTITERWRHGYDVFPDANRTQPFGSGATCYYPFLDLVVKNAASQSFQLHLRIEGNFLVGEWCSNQPVHTTYHIEERDHKITHTSWGGYIRSNRLVRIKEGENEEKEIVRNEAIMMYEPLLCVSVSHLPDQGEAVPRG